MIDPITLEPIYKNSINAVSIHKQLYYANSLIDLIIFSYKEKKRLMRNNLKHIMALH